MSAEDNQPDWNRIAEKFDIWLPQIAPVGEALLDSLDIVPGDRVLDLASGTGEPALTLARRNRGDIEIVGIDSAEGMVRVAQAKVGAENLSGIRFECMPAEDLRFADHRRPFPVQLAGTRKRQRVTSREQSSAGSSFA